MDGVIHKNLSFQRYPQDGWFFYWIIMSLLVYIVFKVTTNDPLFYKLTWILEEILVCR